MSIAMAAFHDGIKLIAGELVIKTDDYSMGLNGLPKSDVLKYHTNFGSVVVRPSGTEPKLKIYISVTAEDKGAAEKTEATVIKEMETILHNC